MSDLIDRQAAIDALDAVCDRECEYSKQQRSVMCGACRLGSAFDAIEELPSAQPRMKGRWIKQIDESINAWWYECSVCGDYPLKNAFGHDSLSQFCPWCGAIMYDS